MSEQQNAGRGATPSGGVQPIAPQLVPRIWGGKRLRTLLGIATSDAAAIGEAWFGHARAGTNFPLVKLLDVADRLSVQVHPNDTLASELHGEGEIGKHEAWVILDAAPGATILLGREPSVSPDHLAESLTSGAPIEPLLARVPVSAGDVIDVPPGLLHALMPGLLVWEVQQPSDRTYRVSDWGRSDTQRPLHRSEAARATNSAAIAGRHTHLPRASGEHELLSSGALKISAVVGPWSGRIAVSSGAVATLVPARGESIAPSDSSEANALLAPSLLSRGTVGGHLLAAFASARLAEGHIDVVIPDTLALLVGTLQR